MLSGNGRHRRPRQAPALVVAAGVTGSAIAIPLLGAVNAHAADGTTWDRLAQCESEGDWSAKSNSHYGGLQLTQEMWVTYGGLDYAASPDLASRSEQIAVAETVLAKEGPSAWPYCAILVGLTSDDSSSPATSDPDPSASATADPDPSASADPTGEPSPSGSSAQSSPSSESSASPSPSASDDAGAPSGGAGGSSHQGGASDGSGSSDGAGRHRGGSDHGRDGRDGRTGEPAGRHASRDGGHADEAYTVRPGDNLWAIAEAHDLKGGWTALYAANKETVGDDPDLILPGQRLDLS